MVVGMPMRALLIACWAIGCCAIAARGAPPPNTTSPERPPNIVLILADDLGINDLACYGRQEHHTPALDQLAAEGLRSTAFYCAQPICSPSRAALLTGRAPARLHLTTYLPGRPDTPAQPLLHPVMRRQLPLEETTLAETLRAAGYTTAAIGKWHLGGPAFGPLAQGFDFAYPERLDQGPPRGTKGEEELTDQAIRFLTEHRDQPVFVYLAHYSPHIPLVSPSPEDAAQYAHSFNPAYAAMIVSLDASVGRLLRAIDDLKLRDHSIVLFTSDNGGLHVPEGRDGPPTHNTPYRAGKGFLYEGGLRVPLLLRWPGHVAAGKVSDLPWGHADLLPTLLEWVGAPAPAGLDGFSLARQISPNSPQAPSDAIAAKLPPGERSFYWHFPHYTNQGSRPAGAIRRGPWKFIEYYGEGQLELFQLLDDPSEQTNLAAQMPQRVTELRDELHTWLDHVAAQRNRPNQKVDPTAYRRIYFDHDVSRLAPTSSAEILRQQWNDWRQAIDGVLLLGGGGR